MMSWASIALPTTALTCVIRFPHAPKINRCNKHDTEMVCLIAFDFELLWIDVQAGMVTW